MSVAKSNAQNVFMLHQPSYTYYITQGLWVGASLTTGILSVRHVIAVDLIDLYTP